MNISIIGPEESGKTRLAKELAKKMAGNRPIFMIGEIKSEFPSITLDQFGTVKNCVVIVDDANALLDQYELSRKQSPMRKPLFVHRHWNRVNIFVFHSADDAVKPIFRQSRFIYSSVKYRDSSFENNKFIKGVPFHLVGRRKAYQFREYKRY